MTKPTKPKKPPRDVLADLAALGGEMETLAAYFVLRKPDALEQAAFLRGREDAARQAHERKAETLNRTMRKMLADPLPWERAKKRRRESIVAACGAVLMHRDEALAALAAAERHAKRIRAIDAVLARYSKLAPTWRTDEGPTPEKRVQKAWDRDPILVLLETGKITANQAKAARHMAAVFHGMTAAIMPRVGKMDPTPGAPRDSGWKEYGIPGWAWTTHARVYKPWADEMLPRAGVPLPVMVEICIDGHALNTVATRHRLWHRTVLKLLSKGLDLYNDRLRSHGGKSDRDFTMSDLPAHLLEHQELTSEPGPIPSA